MISDSQSFASASTSAFASAPAPADPTDEKRPVTILLRSGWQTVNIGDIAHTPGILRVFEKHAPHIRFILWPGLFDRGVDAMLRRRFPKIRLVRDAARWRPAKPMPGDCTLAEAFAGADLMLHSSGPGVYNHDELDQWIQTGKPWAVFGVTVGSNVGVIDTTPDFPPELAKLINTSALFFTRETRSLAAARQAGVTTPLDFCPDATFALDNLRDEAAADALLAAHKLEAGRFLCVIPRLRLTPYWTIHPERPFTAETIATREKFNAAQAPADFAALRGAITHWVRATGDRVLLCPEMIYATELFEPHIISQLPADVRLRVTALDRYWITDEASSVYARASLVLSMECHSPIMAIATGRPTIYLHQPQDTWKVQMYPDLGLGDWAIPIDAPDAGKRLAACMTAIHQDYPAALAHARAACSKAGALLADAARRVEKLAAQQSVPAG
ncbi:MAG: polysaccharide pyruvyl transferase family protein [Opitutaceae bacterium]|jgi:polysaccharide pyruvyl transferase WcaK-like protein|nr:polysaccharide pyruvyl transferase family protein [Opitutaceae bacterium]